MTNKTYSGKPKPAGRSGHFYESRRHSLQAQGIHTGHLAEISMDQLNLMLKQPGKFGIDLTNPQDPNNPKWQKEYEQLRLEKLRREMTHDDKADPDFMKKRQIAIDIASQSDGGDNVFWIGGPHFKKEKMEADIAKYDKVLEGTGAGAGGELSRSYNPQGIPYGVAIHGYSPEIERKLMEKYKFGEDDLWIPEN